ncbi:MAG: hypothetical protein AAGG51_00480 [Cyanobacteria bacterium P01_G01_bin.54]
MTPPKKHRAKAVQIQHLAIHTHHLEIGYQVDQFRFSTQVYYHDVSFEALASQYSPETVDRLAAHIALFEGMKFCSLFPQTYDVGLIAKHLPPPALDLFGYIYQGVFKQHWYENDVVDYRGPKILYSEAILGDSQPVTIASDRPTVLAPCGGGKDSAFALKMLAAAEVPFAAMQYSHSVYGKADFQHDLIAPVVEATYPLAHHKLSIIDDFLDFPFFELYFSGNSGITAPETPVSIFEALPIMLFHGYPHLGLAHEKSANTGNFIWEKIGQEVNHQWGKGYAAEQAMNQFIQAHLLTNFSYFSLLQPIYDFRIFRNLVRYPELLPKIHSCNIQKPWCKKCPKCAYVWLGLMSVFEPELVNAVFGSNLFDDPDLLPTFREMIGLAEHTPFECIGEIDESRLAMKTCLEKGLSGQALTMFEQEVLSDRTIDWQALEQKYNTVYRDEHSIPDWIFDKIQSQL